MAPDQREWIRGSGLRRQGSNLIELGLKRPCMLRWRWSSLAAGGTAVWKCCTSQLCDPASPHRPALRRQHSLDPDESLSTGLRHAARVAPDTISFQCWVEGVDSAKQCMMQPTLLACHCDCMNTFGGAQGSRELPALEIPLPGSLNAELEGSGRWLQELDIEGA